ncbi:hypothetical protein ACQP2H_11495 [Micromonospora sp. CA-248260]|uniref:hypothetical protein n=1 Tax=Micromonospora sp. CA-248260 TaxID=3239962 RepID=UPI003D9378D7
MSTEVPRQFKPNLVLVNRRKAAGWESRKRAARELHRVGQQRGIRETPTVEAIEKAMYRHETGRVAVTDPIYRQLYCLVYDAKPHDLFGELTSGAEDRPHFSARSHKFVTAFVGVDGAARLREAAGCTPAVGEWHTCCSTPVEHPEGDCTLYVWPCGSVVFHLVEPVQLSTIAALAAWRVASYGDNIAWAIDYLARISPSRGRVCGVCAWRSLGGRASMAGGVARNCPTYHGDAEGVATPRPSDG